MFDQMPELYPRRVKTVRLDRSGNYAKLQAPVPMVAEQARLLFPPPEEMAAATTEAFCCFGKVGDA